MMFNMTQRGTLPPYMVFSMTKEANTDILCEGEVDTEKQILLYCTMTMST